MKTLQKPVPPGGTIGIIGGGQLGRMLALAASALGLKTCIYNDTADAPAFQVTPHSFAESEDRGRIGAAAASCQEPCSPESEIGCGSENRRQTARGNPSCSGPRRHPRGAYAAGRGATCRRPCAANSVDSVLRPEDWFRPGCKSRPG